MPVDLWRCRLIACGAEHKMGQINCHRRAEKGMKIEIPNWRSDMSAESSTKPRPKLVVFDLDRTLWPFWVDTHVDPPFHKKGGEVYDSDDRKVRPFPEATEMLAWLHSEGYILGAASRTGEVRGAKQLMKLFEWDRYFTYKEIYPGCKKHHFSRIRSMSQVDFADMIFFDDEPRNIRDLKQCGVVSILVGHSGVTRSVVEKGFAQFAEERSRVGK